MDKKVGKKKKNYVYLYAIVLGLTFFWWFVFARPSEDLDKYICRDYDLATYSTKSFKNNVSSLAKFYYQRTESCVELMDLYKENRGVFNRLEKCSIIDAATESVVPLSQLLLVNGEDKLASAELVKVLNAMRPYDYCIQYDSNLRSIVKFKKLADL